MKNKKNEKLLADLIRDGSESFRQELYIESLRELKRRKRSGGQWFHSPLAIAAGVVFIAGLLLFGLAKNRRKGGDVAQTRTIDVAPVSIVGMEIVTNSFPPMAVVESPQSQSLIVENSSVRKSVEILGDTDLLALFPDRAAGLIANSSGLVQLVFLDSRERAVRE